MYTRSLSLHIPDRELTDNDYTPMMMQESLDGDSIKMPLDTFFPVSTTTFHDHEPFSQDHTDDHNNNATLLHHEINKSVEGTIVVDDPDAKTDDVPQI